SAPHPRTTVQHLAPIDRAPVSNRPEHDDRSDHKRAGGIPKPPCDPDRGESRLSRKPGQIERGTADCGAEKGRKAGADNCEFCDSRGSYKSLCTAAPLRDQVTTHHTFQRVADRNRGRRFQGSRGCGVGGECADQDCRKETNAAQNDGRKSQARPRPDRASAWVYRGELQAERCENKVGNGHHGQPGEKSAETTPLRRFRLRRSRDIFHRRKTTTNPPFEPY